MSLPIHALVRQAALDMLNSDSDDDFDLVKQPAAKRVCTPRRAELLELSVGQDDQGWFVAGQDDQVGTQIQAEA